MTAADGTATANIYSTKAEAKTANADNTPPQPEPVASATPTDATSNSVPGSSINTTGARAQATVASITAPRSASTSTRWIDAPRTKRDMSPSSRSDRGTIAISSISPRVVPRNERSVDTHAANAAFAVGLADLGGQTGKPADPAARDRFARCFVCSVPFGFCGSIEQRGRCRLSSAPRGHSSTAKALKRPVPPPATTAGGAAQSSLKR